MSINTGLLLRRFGESAYGRYRRFLIANNGISHHALQAELYQVCRNNHTIDIPDSKISYKQAKLAATREDFLIEESSLEILKYLDIAYKYRPVKCCNICSASGYHSNLFDLPGLETCPVHKEKLTRRCKKCGRNWPTANELIARKCSVCGVRMSVDDLINNFDHGLHKKYEEMNKVQQLLESGYTYFSQNFFVSRYKNEKEKIRPITSRTSPFYISVIVNYLRNQLSEYEETTNLLAIPFDLVKETYQVRKISRPKFNLNRKENLTLKAKLIEKTLNSLTPLLQKKNHTLGVCPTHPLLEQTCHVCNTINVWKRVVNYREAFAIDPGSEFKEFLTAQLVNFIYIQKPEEPHVYSVLYVIDDGTEGYIKVPPELSMMLYEHDLWTTALHVYHYLKHVNTQIYINRKSTKLDIYGGLSGILLAAKSRFSPYVMKLNGSTLDVYYPNDIFTNKLETNDRLEKLLI